ncbi:MAG: DUF4349 domain-containing protein, partial [Acidimicrobiia bacterium]|nr:DUF4349 domain-containing protein [Acidimicrobiia bacterium]
MVRRSIVPITVVITILLAACTGGEDATSVTEPNGDDGFTTTTVSAERSLPTSDAGGSDAEEPTNAVQAVLQTTDVGRSIVFTADITVEVDDVVSASERARAAVAGLGGILFGQETRTGPDARSVLTIKVPPENFSAALERLAGIGSLRTQDVRADDVTERVVDLESRIRTAAASVERLRSFLDTAADLEDLASLEAELLQRETDLEILRGRLRTLEDQVALATIVLVLTEATPEP